MDGGPEVDIEDGAVTSHVVTHLRLMPTKGQDGIDLIRWDPAHPRFGHPVVALSKDYTDLIWRSYWTWSQAVEAMVEVRDLRVMFGYGMTCQMCPTPFHRMATEIPGTMAFLVQMSRDGWKIERTPSVDLKEIVVDHFHIEGGDPVWDDFWWESL